MTDCQTTILVLAAAMSLVSCAKPPAQEKPAPPVSAPAVVEKRPPAPSKVSGQITSISMEKLFQLHQNGEVFLLDARPSFFYSIGHIRGAISMPKGGSVKHIGMRKEEIKTALAANKTIVVYCTNASCPDARSVASNLSEAGYPCSVLVGGYESWKESGLPVE